MTAIGIGWGISWFAYASDYSRFVPRSMPARKLYAASALGPVHPRHLARRARRDAGDRQPGRRPRSAHRRRRSARWRSRCCSWSSTGRSPPTSSTSTAPRSARSPWTCKRRPQGRRLRRRRLRLRLHRVAGLPGRLRVTRSTAGWPAWSPGSHRGGRSCSCISTGSRRQRIDVPALYDEPGHSRLGDFRWDAIIAFLVGIVATWFFEFGIPSALQGPGAKALGNVDLSWLAGALSAGLIYALLAARRRTDYAADVATRPEARV